MQCMSLQLYEHKFLSPKKCFVSGWNWPSGSVEKDKNVLRKPHRRRTASDQQSSLPILGQLLYMFMHTNSNEFIITYIYKK